MMVGELANRHAAQRRSDKGRLVQRVGAVEIIAAEKQVDPVRHVSDDAELLAELMIALDAAGPKKSTSLPSKSMFASS